MKDIFARELKGHSITMDVYGDNRGIIADCVDEIQPFIDEVLPTEDIDSEIQTPNCGCSGR